MLIQTHIFYFMGYSLLQHECGWELFEFFKTVPAVKLTLRSILQLRKTYWKSSWIKIKNVNGVHGLEIRFYLISKGYHKNQNQFTFERDFQ